jgi:hypothetical protein
MFAGRFGTAAKVAVAVCVVLVVVAGGWYGFEYFKPKPDVQLIDKYFAGYRDANLSAVRSTVSGDILDSMPTSQTVFYGQVTQSPGDRIKSWTVTHVDRDPYVGQSIAEVTVVTATRTMNVEIDVWGFTEGLRIRQVKDLADAGSPLNTNAPGSTSAGYHGSTGAGGMSGPAPGSASTGK